MTKISKEDKTKIEGYISAGMDYSEVKEKIKEDGIDYPSLSKQFYEMRKKLFPDVPEAVNNAMGDEEKKKKKSEKSARKWTTQEAKKADESQLAEIINEAVCNLLPCKAAAKDKAKIDEWKVECKKINLGGAVVGLIMYIFPSISLNHPVIIFVSRLLIFAITFYRKCMCMYTKVKDVLGKGETKNEHKH